MTHECTEKRFLDDTRSHNMAIHLDEGVHRHLTFSRNGTNNCRFDLLTWPGHLTITGDCGTYTFQRTNDMFGFFRLPEHIVFNAPDRMHFINPGYWGEKLLSVCCQGKYRVYSEDAFKERVTEHFDQFSAYISSVQGDALWEAIEQDVLSVLDSEHAAYSAVHDFEYGNFTFQDFFDGSGTEVYSHHYIWNLYAIVSGIDTYDKHKNKES